MTGLRPRWLLLATILAIVAGITVAVWLYWSVTA